MGAQGSTTVDFGAFPGSFMTSVDVTGLTGYVATSLAEAWLVPKATADHTSDEYVVEDLRVMAQYQADGTIRIHAISTADYPNMRIYGQWNVGWVWN